MNELDAVKSHHDSLPGPSPEVTAHAWVLLTQEADTEQNGHRSPEPSRRRFRRGLPGGSWALRAGVAVGLAAAVTAGLILVRGGDLGTPPASAAELLRHAASAAARGDVRPGPGQFVYVEHKDVTFATGSEGEYTQDVRREVWLPGGDPAKALTRSTYGQTHVVSGNRPVHVQPPGTVEYRRAGQCHDNPLGLPLQGTDLSADPDQVLAGIRRNAEKFVREDQGRRGEVGLGQDEIDMRIDKVVASSLLTQAQDPLTSAQTRASIFGALSKMTTVTIVPNLTDSAGRKGVGASLKLMTPDGGWEREELIFEPATYRFLGFQSWIGRQEGGRVSEVRAGSTAVMTVKVVDSMPEVPKNAPKPMFC